MIFRVPCSEGGSEREGRWNRPRNVWKQWVRGWGDCVAATKVGRYVEDKRSVVFDAFTKAALPAQDTSSMQSDEENSSSEPGSTSPPPQIPLDPSFLYVPPSSQPSSNFPVLPPYPPPFLPLSLVFSPILLPSLL
eukprot:110613-Rhodomonas_salina.1